VFLFCLPPLLFPPALFTSWRDFRANLRPISLLAVGLVLFTTVTVAYLAYYFMNLPLTVGFLLGAIISPPDAIAATAIAGRLKMPRRIVTILERESLVNDATALVAYRFALAAVVTGSFSLPQASARFVLAGTGGILVGLAVAWLAREFHKRVDDAPIEITVSLLTPFVAYLVAERVSVSGVLSVVTAGIYLGRLMPELLSSKTRLQPGPVWEMVQFLLNGVVFLLIRLEFPDVLSTLSTAQMSIRDLVWHAIFMSVAVILVRMRGSFPRRICRGCW
jgi:Na+/H+ antiporter